MENKYQEALNLIKPATNDCELIKATQTVQELVELHKKQIPIKVLNKRRHRIWAYYLIGDCPSCNKTIGSISDECDKCNQKLDWSDEE